MQWRMRSVERKVQIPRLLARAGLIKKLQCVIDVSDRCVEIGVRNFPGLTVQPKCFVAFEEIAGATEVTEVAIEAEIGRLLL